MKESAAWREIARRVATRGRVGVGLCAEISHGTDRWSFRLEEPVILSDAQAHRMRVRVNAHLNLLLAPDDLRVLVSSRDTVEDADYDNIRVLAALFLAFECEDEGR